jgi:MFS family permease
MNKTGLFHTTLTHLRLPSRHGITSAPTASPERAGMQDRVKRSLRLATIEAIPGRFSLAVSENFVIPFSLVLTATSVQMGLLSTLPHLVAALSQLATPSVINRMGSRRRVLQLSGVLSAIAFIGASTVLLLPESVQIWALLFFAVLALAFIHFPNPAWGSWVSALVPAGNRGKYLGTRSIVASGAALVIFVFAGFFLDSIKEQAIIGFAVLFGLAAIFRLSSATIFGRVYEPALGECRLKSPSFVRFVRDLPRSNLGHFMLYSMALNFGVYIAGPFFTVYQLRDLGFSYTTYMGLAVTSTLATMVGLRLWGAFSDKHGNLRVIRLTSLGVLILPILWLLVNDPLDALWMQLIGGLSWAGLSLCSVNFVYECSTEENRASNIAYYYALNGIALFLGGITGGFLVGHLPPILGSSLLTIFVISGVLRFAASFAFLPFVNEVRQGQGKPKARIGKAHA